MTVSVASAGLKSGNYAIIKVSGNQIKIGKSRNNNHRGMNMVALHPTTHRIII